MKTLPRALATFVAIALTLAASAVLAVEYDDIIALTRDGTSTQTIMELIVKDGRAFEMSDDEMQRLKDENVDPDVVKAMLDPSYAQTWLDSNAPDDGQPAPDQGGGGGGGNGYQSSLDQAYGQGYADGQTSLVYSLGYYYGPLSRYYYVDPFYYSFWFSGYSYGYWPSYCAYYYRPSYSWCGAYPYNYYNYNSYYCHTYYDPGYYRANGYTVPSGGRTIWDNGPRYRDGGVAPGGTVDNRVAMSQNLGRPSSPPVVRGTGTVRMRDLVANNGTRDGRVTRSINPVSPRTGQVSRTGDVTQPRSGEVTRTRGGGNGTRIDRSAGDVSRGNEASRMVRDGRAPRTQTNPDASTRSRGVERSWLPRRNDGSTYGVRRVGGSSQGATPGTRSGVSRGVRRFDEQGFGGVANSRRSAQRGGGSSYDPGRQVERMAPQTYRAPESRGNGGGTQMRGNGGGGAAPAPSRGGGGGGGGAQMRGGGGGGGGAQARGGGGGGGGGNMGHAGHAGGR